ncbi:protein transporter tim10 [Kappamyces sp. JEL0829]|nr:protein transporter tim10 [Kappamyces sp. JEL0829]
MFFSSQPSISPELMQAELNMDIFVEFQSTAIETCRKRCVSNEYKFDQLGRAEAVCSDRCISKFFEASQLLQELTLKEMQKKQELMQNK